MDFYKLVTVALKGSSTLPIIFCVQTIIFAEWPFSGPGSTDITKTNNLEVSQRSLK